MNTLTKDFFERWMRAIIGRLDRHEEMLHTMNKSTETKRKEPTIERMLDNQDVCLLFQVSKRTLQRYRSEGMLKYQTLGQKIYYTENDLLCFLSSNLKYCKEKNAEFYKTRINNIINN